MIRLIRPVEGLSRLVLAVLAFGCMDQPTRIRFVGAPETLTFSDPNDRVDLQVSVRDQNGTEIAHPPIRWTSSNPSVAEVSKTGRVTPKSDGRAIITARTGYIEKEVPLIVRFYAALDASESDVRLAPGEKHRLIARIIGRDGSVIDGPLTWSSSDSTVATVDSQGVVFGLAPGVTTVRVSAKHLSLGITVIVNVETSS